MMNQFPFSSSGDVITKAITSACSRARQSLEACSAGFPSPVWEVNEVSTTQNQSWIL